VRKYWADAFAKYEIDALIFPTVPHFAATQGPEASGVETFLRYIRNTDPGATAGVPGLSIPAGLGRSRLPVGIEIDGPHWSDRRLLAIGLAVEQVLARTPPPSE
jgi:mandelamide amidase